MKYLKRIFENRLVFDLNNLNDIFDDGLSDLGYYFKVGHDWWSHRESKIEIVFYNKNMKLFLDEIYDVIKQAKSILESEGYYLDPTSQEEFEDFGVLMSNPESKESLDVLKYSNCSIKLESSSRLVFRQSNFTLYFRQS